MADGVIGPMRAWGARNLSSGTAGSIAADLRLTELNYDPAKPATGSPYNNDDFEFVELKNFGTQTLDLSGVSFTDGISYTFPSGVTLAPARRVCW